MMEIKTSFEIQQGLDYAENLEEYMDKKWVSLKSLEIFITPEKINEIDDLQILQNTAFLILLKNLKEEVSKKELEREEK